MADPCVFCAIIAGTEPATIVRQWPDAIAIVPLDPVTDGHLLVIPREHVPDFTTAHYVSAITTHRAAELAEEIGGSMNLITSKGREATQSVAHLHLHLVPRRENDGLALPWYSGRTRRPRTASGAGPVTVINYGPPTRTYEDGLAQGFAAGPPPRWTRRRDARMSQQEMSAEEERDLLARQRDWLLGEIARNYRSARWMRDTIHRAFIHDPADEPAWVVTPGHEFEVLLDRAVEVLRAIGLEAQLVASLTDGTAEIAVTQRATP